MDFGFSSSPSDGDRRNLLYLCGFFASTEFESIFPELSSSSPLPASRWLGHARPADVGCSQLIYCASAVLFHALCNQPDHHCYSARSALVATARPSQICPLSAALSVFITIVSDRTPISSIKNSHHIFPIAFHRPIQTTTQPSSLTSNPYSPSCYHLFNISQSHLPLLISLA